MKLRINVFVGAIVVALLLPRAAFAGQKCWVAGEPTAESYAWNFPGEASELLASAESGANRVADLADRLAFWPTTTRLSHVSQLMEIGDEINDLGKILCRLQIIHRVVLPWQQNAIDRTLPQLKEMAADTGNAIRFVNENPGNLFHPEYREYAGSLYEASTDLATMLDHFQEYAQAKDDLNRLEQTLELRPVS